MNSGLISEKAQVICRIRPARNTNELNQKRCVNVLDGNTVMLSGFLDPKFFTFDFVASEAVAQEELYDVVGEKYVQACIDGYNGSILCYGQTGSGKTYTMFGASAANIANQTPSGFTLQSLNSDSYNAPTGQNTDRNISSPNNNSAAVNSDPETSEGLVPRILERIWQRIYAHTSTVSYSYNSSVCSNNSNNTKTHNNSNINMGSSSSVTVSISFVEIYQEKVGTYTYIHTSYITSIS